MGLFDSLVNYGKSRIHAKKNDLKGLISGEAKKTHGDVSKKLEGIFGDLADKANNKVDSAFDVFKPGTGGHSATKQPLPKEAKPAPKPKAKPARQRNHGRRK